MTASICFGEFELDAADRQLRRGGETVELNGRYFDALALLASEPGRLVTKDRFLDEVWRGVPVTDEALTQCIKTLRRQLGDDASRPPVPPVPAGVVPSGVADRVGPCVRGVETVDRSYH